MIKKAPPVQYVKVCDQYGVGYWQIPGTTFCMSYRGSAQVDNTYYPTKDEMWVQQSSSSGKYTLNLLQPGQQDKEGTQISAQIAFDLSTMTSWGRFQTFVNFKVTSNEGNFASFTDPGGLGKTSISCFKCWMEWAGFTVGKKDSVFSDGAFHQDDLSNTTMGEKGGGWIWSYTWTPSGPGQPSAKGTKPHPDGWSFVVSAEDPFGHRADSQFDSKHPYQSLFINGAKAKPAPAIALVACPSTVATCGTFVQRVQTSAAGLGWVNPADGPLNFPDFVFAIHDEEDPPGPEGNAQNQTHFGLATVHLAAAAHNVSTIAAAGGTGSSAGVGDSNKFNSAKYANNPFVSSLNDNSLIPGGATFADASACANSPAAPTPSTRCNSRGPTNQFWGFALDAGARFYTPMSPGTMRGALRQPDYVWIMFDYAKGALQYAGFHDQGNLSVGDTYTMGGFARDDQDAKFVNGNNGSYYADQETTFVVNTQWHHILTDCTDPVHCFRMNLYAAGVWVNPGAITRNTDWTAGGLGNARKLQLTANVIWGANGDPTIPKQTSGELAFEVQYNKLWQDLPNNCNGDITAAGQAACAGVAPTALPVGITKDPSNVVFRLTATKSW